MWSLYEKQIAWLFGFPASTHALCACTKAGADGVQICWAYRGEGGRTVVVLCARQKLDMELLFRRVLPKPARFGTRFVFRQACSSGAVQGPGACCAGMVYIAQGIHSHPETS